jgi:S1-C subfamily serine protease
MEERKAMSDAPGLRRRLANTGGLALVAGAICAIAIAAVPAAFGADASRTVTSPITGIVDINTNLALENAEAAGTGLVLTSNGEILTNNHVIRGATTVRVTDLDNGRTYSGTVVGYSASDDVAVVQLKNASGLKVAPLGNSASAKIGEAITAIGNAGGVGGTPSSASGTITHLNQSITASDEGNDPEQLKGLIETNAQLQPGDSGGPLVNSAGQVIGMDTAASTSFSFSNSTVQGFTIPIDSALTLAGQIEAKQASATVHIGPTPFLGITVQPNQQSNFYNPQASAGALIYSVFPSSPIAKAGLTPGDVIRALDGKTISSPEVLTSLLITKAPGNKVTLSWVDQYGNSHSSTIVLASGPPQ